MTPQQLLDRYLELERLERTTAKERDDVLLQLFAACPHTDVFEVDHRSGSYITLRPYRVCRFCGYAEEGWGCGYLKLKTRLAILPRAEGDRLVRRQFTQEDLYGS